MRFALVYSSVNIAGTTIIKEFKKIAFTPQIPIIELKKETIYSDDLNVKNYPILKNIDFIVFASTHKSAKGTPSLSIHAPGNFRNADLGGKDHKICKSSAFVMKYLFKELNKNYEKYKTNLQNEYQITLEVTHHGPLIEIPCLFIELGSIEEQWRDESAAAIVAKTILSLENYIVQKDWEVAFGIGGPHYAPNFNKIQLNSNYALSHIIPEYVFPINEQMIIECEKKTSEQVNKVIIDWKGCGNSESRTKILKIIENYGLEYLRTSEIEKDEI